MEELGRNGQKEALLSTLTRFDIIGMLQKARPKSL
jgi:hypothetical protein